MSRRILTDLLRGELGFDGVIVSDSMNMRAMRRHFDSADAAIRAFNAGVDVLMLAEEHYDHNAEQYLESQRRLVGAVIAAVERGDLPMARVDDAVRRVLKLKTRYPAPPDDEGAVQIIGSTAHQTVELQAARAAVAILRNRHTLLPLRADRPLVVINTTRRSAYGILGATRGIGPNQTTPAFDSFTAALRGLHDSVTVYALEDVLDGLPSLPADALIIAVTENYPLPGMDFEQASQVEWVNRLARICPDRLVVVALRDPYELAEFAGVDTYVCAFSFRPCAAQAAAEVICGKAAASGVSPVSVPGTEIIAAGMIRA